MRREICSLATDIFGEEHDVHGLQMAARAALIFLFCLVMIRLSGRRSFSMKAPTDNIVLILLGAVLSRAVVGASPFWPVICSSFTIVLLHRGLAWTLIRNKTLNNLISGSPIVVFENGNFITENMQRALICEDDVLRAVRSILQQSDMHAVQKVIMEKSGELTVVADHNKQ